MISLIDEQPWLISRSIHSIDENSCNSFLETLKPSRRKTATPPPALLTLGRW